MQMYLIAVTVFHEKGPIYVFFHNSLK